MSTGGGWDSHPDVPDADSDDAPDADVAVVGYGPAGMAMAGLLAQAGRTVVVLERYDSLYNLPRAAIFDDETMRTLAKLGVAERLLPGLRVQRSYEWRNAAGELLIEHSFDDTGRSGWAEWYMMYQPQLEDALDQVCRGSGLVQVRHGCPVVGLTQDAAGVTLTVGGADGARDTVRARYVVACDGGNSTVRGLLGGDQDDYGFSEPWMVCDFRFSRPVSIPTALQVGDPRQPTSVISLGPDHHRFSFMLDSEADFAVQRRPDLVWARVADYLAPGDAELIRVATYTFRSLVAHRWREGRVLLAGDAAHQMPPFLGQGMCSGIRDAQNLAFKLDLLLAARAGDGLLDTYQAEREPHVRAVVEKGIELGRIQTVRDPERAAERDRRLLALRAAHEAPEKMWFPGLTTGLLSATPSAARGQLSVQAEVDDGRRRGRFDEVVGLGTVLLLTVQRYGELARTGLVPVLRDAGVLVAALGRDPNDLGGADVVLDATGAYHRWFAELGASAVAVRPDFYVYGSADDAAGTAALAGEVMLDLAPAAGRREAAAVAG